MRDLKQVVLGAVCLVLTAVPLSGQDYREEMRNFVRSIAQYAEAQYPSFIIIPQNGQEILTIDGEADGPVHTGYLNAIDAIGREDLFYGYRKDNRQTPGSENEYLLEWCRLYRENGVSVLVTDYCSAQDKMDDSYRLNRRYGFLSFAAPERELNEIPSYPDPLPGENRRDINVIADARNFLYLINGEKFRSKDEFLNAVGETSYDLIIMDLFFDNESFSPGDLNRIRRKQNGGGRLLICYMSIGEAEDYRYYWKPAWSSAEPDWIEEENPDWEGNYKVRYWDAGWQSNIFGNPDAYLDRILEAGFDGVYLDIIDAFEYFE